MAPVVVVLTAPFGGGHKAAAEAVASVLNQAHMDARVVDLAAAISHRLPLNKIIESLYRWFSTWGYGIIHAVIYHVADHYPGVVSRMVNLLFGTRIKRWAEGLGSVDAFVSTFHVIGYILNARLNEHDRPPLITLVTDAGRVNRMWFVGQADRFILSDHATTHLSTSFGVPPDRVSVAEPPIFVEPETHLLKADARRRLGLSDKFTILLTAGGSGIGQGVLRSARALAKSSLDIQLILNAGTNTRLLRRFRKLAIGGEHRVIGFTSEFEVLLSACDLVISKAGWLTINAAMANTRPMLIVDVIRGQEAANCTKAVEMRVARRVSSKEIVPEVGHLVESSPSETIDYYHAHLQTRRSHWRDHIEAAISGVIATPEA